MKLTLKVLKPRNPFVAPCRNRKAGRHAPGRGARRHGAERAARQEVFETLGARAPM